MVMNQVIPGITSPNKLTIPVGSRDHIQGLIDAPISLLEYGDYECPASGKLIGSLRRFSKVSETVCVLHFETFPDDDTSAC